ncbi:MAG TPA: DUF4058 family protein [Tepidisphaeraceae bacterium]|nr:DUF4058 family protein [Tepidisphaeraceae bacterium]
MTSRSPFPGMDPYLESRWSDVHVKLIGFMGEAIQPLLPSDLRARGEERLLLESEADHDEGRQYRSDISVVELPPVSGAQRPLAGTAVATVDPIVIRRQEAPAFDRWIQIIDVSSGNRVVTAIEILSPWNKSSERLNRHYLRKLDDYARAGVSVVEIDLLRYPSRNRLAVTEGDLPADRREAYLTCVRLGWEPDTWRAYPLPLRSQLPAVPIPLRKNEPEVKLDLQPLVERVYAAGGHDDIDYTKPPDPPLPADDAAWAKTLPPPSPRSA